MDDEQLRGKLGPPAAAGEKRELTLDQIEHRRQAWNLHCQGFSHDQIAVSLNISDRTIQTYIKEEYERERADDTGRDFRRTRLAECLWIVIQKTNSNFMAIPTAARDITNAVKTLAQLYGDMAPQKAEVNVKGTTWREGSFGEFTPTFMTELMLSLSRMRGQDLVELLSNPDDEVHRLFAMMPPNSLPRNVTREG